jgi:hypothetical protein
MVVSRLCVAPQNLATSFKGFVAPPPDRHSGAGQRGMTRQSDGSYGPKRSEGGLARASDDARFLDMPSWKARGALGSPIASSDVTETIELVAAPSSRKHASGQVELCVKRLLAVRRRRKLDSPVSEPKLLDPRDISD